MWHYVLTKAQSESLQAVQKRAIHIVHDLTRGMPYSSMLFYSNLNNLASRGEDLSCSFFEMFLTRIPVFIVSFLHLDHRLSPHGSYLPKPFPKSILAHTITIFSYNMALIVTSIKLNPSYFTIVCAHPGSATYYRNILCRLSYNTFAFHCVFETVYSIN